ncbi:MAG: hypothetical protein HWD61_04360 [Parachlamydiaceae bacterium]|nr:MAG: hypothetical protein HWD61_04360 [Parachlamydiaceae bacterium]
MAQKNLPQAPLSSISLINRVSDIEKHPDKITMGQGEYIVFHKLPTGEKQPVSTKTFEEVYKVLLQYSPANIIKVSLKKPMKNVQTVMN